MHWKTVTFLLLAVYACSCLGGTREQYAVKAAQAEARRKVELAIKTATANFRNFLLRFLNPSSRITDLRKPHTKDAEQKSKAVEIVEQAMVELARKHIYWTKLREPEQRQLLTLAGCVNTQTSARCNTDYRTFRSADGSCNNLRQKTWGAANTNFRRLLTAQYENGVNQPKGWDPRRRYFGYLLPTPRQVSLEVVKTMSFRKDCSFSEMIMTWGQFVDHDITLTPLVVSGTDFETDVDCAKTCKNEYPCFPVPPSPKDTRIPKGKCLGLTRSAGSCAIKGSVRYKREQFNALTAYLDASNVYGSTLTEQMNLRDRRRDVGKLKTGTLTSARKPLLPFDLASGNFDCSLSTKTKIPCFLAGDVRVNVQPGLAAIHTVWVREHNRIADTLRRLNPRLSAEKIFQHTRKIIGAQHQVITYKEWLPKIIGSSGMRKMGSYRSYKSYVNANPTNEFATAALRFGHGQVRPNIFRLQNNLRPISKGHIALEKTFFASHLLVEDGIDPYLLGMTGIQSKSMDPDRMLNPALIEKLFEEPGKLSLDLAAFNIQRGRDHGLPGYNAYRRRCGLPSARKMSDFLPQMTRDVVNKLYRVYKHPENVDLWVGGMAERPLPGARVGPTFQCILVEQFRALRDGDRFWYQNPGVFSSYQRRELEKTTLARVLCDGGDRITSMQRDAFRRAGLSDMKPCRSLPAVNLNYWRNLR